MQRGKKNRKNRRQSANSALVAMTNHTGTQPQQDPPGHFHELMEIPCTNHDYPVKHLYKDCQLLKRLLRQAGRPKEEAATEEGGAAGEDPYD